MNDNQTRIIIILGSALAVLLLVLVFVLISGDGGDTEAADTSTSEATTTTAAPSTSEASSTTAAPTTSAATTTSSSTTSSTTTTSTTTTTTTLPPNFALAFDGSDDYAAIPNLSGDFTFGDGMLVEAWVKPTTLTSDGAYAGVVRGANDEPPVGTGKWVLFLDNGDHSDWGYSGCVPSCNSVTTGPGGLVAGVWQHVAAQYDGTTIQIYYNGAFVDSTPLSGDLGNIGVVLIGYWADSFNGLIDEVRIWNTPRGPAAIGDDWDRILDGDEVGLVGYYRFDEGSGQIVSDSSTAGNAGRLGSAGGADAQDPTWVPSDIPIP